MGKLDSLPNINDHCVYYLYDAAGVLAYIGRSLEPEVRRRAAQRRYKLALTMRVSKPMHFDKACELERSEIQRYWPRFNKVARSSSCMYGHRHVEAAKAKMRQRTLSEEHKKAVGNAQRGKPKSAVTRARISDAKMGHEVSESVRARLREFHTGLMASEFTKEKMRAAAARNSESKSLTRLIWLETQFRQHFGYVPLTKQEILNAT